LPTPDPSQHSDIGQSSVFCRLDERIERWIWAESWNELREVSPTPRTSPPDSDPQFAARFDSGPGG
jgi:hypothetical protein